MSLLPPERDPLPQMMAKAEVMVPESEVRERIAEAVAAERERCARFVEQFAAESRELSLGRVLLPHVAGLLRQGGEGGGT